MTGSFFILQEFIQSVLGRRVTGDNRVSSHFGGVRTEYCTYGIRLDMGFESFLRAQHFADVAVSDILLEVAVRNDFTSASSWIAAPPKAEKHEGNNHI